MKRLTWDSLSFLSVSNFSLSSVAYFSFKLETSAIKSSFFDSRSPQLSACWKRKQITDEGKGTDGRWSRRNSRNNLPLPGWRPLFSELWILNLIIHQMNEISFYNNYHCKILKFVYPIWFSIKKPKLFRNLLPWHFAIHDIEQKA